MYPLLFISIVALLTVAYMNCFVLCASTLPFSFMFTGLYICIVYILEFGFELLHCCCFTTEYLSLHCCALSQFHCCCTDPMFMHFCTLTVLLQSSCTCGLNLVHFMLLFGHLHLYTPYFVVLESSMYW